jgi:sphingomyelin phosphodiesterase acid-like 3
VPVPELSTGTVIKVITNMTMTVQNLFPNLQVFPALGNHDYWPQVKLTSASRSAEVISLLTVSEL